MGIYVDPRGMTKDEWIVKHAREVPESEWTWEKRPKGELPLCRIDSGSFSGVLIAYSPNELRRALPRPDDQRPRRYFFAPIEDLRRLPKMSRTFEDIKLDVAEGYIQTDAEL